METSRIEFDLEDKMSTMRKVLILGAGELGFAITTKLLSHPSYSPNTVTLTIAVREATLASLLDSSDDDHRSQHILDLQRLRSQAVAFVAADITEHSSQSLTDLFRQYNCIIHAGGMSLPTGSQLKVTNAALAAAVDEYIPWQWGVDYDTIGREGGLGLFREQLDVRDILRAQTQTRWFILSCGVFMSFLFAEFWGVVVRDDDDHNDRKISGIRALGGWDHLITATTAEDIARANAELVLVDTHERGRAVYIAGDSMTYGELADSVEKVVGRRLVSREVWTTEWLRDQSVKEPGDKLWKYRVVFSEDRGLAWRKRGTYNDEKGIEMEGIEAYMRRLNIR